MEDFPVAIHLASEESVFHNQGVLFHLVRPTQKGDGVESAAGLANVIPRKRIYRMETVEELEIFKNELLRRPLVLQPTSHSGRGLGRGSATCPLKVDHVNWVLLINQTHPKILGRIQMGVDAAKKAMENEEQFLLRYKFGDLLQRLHFKLFDDGLRSDDTLQSLLMYFRYSEWTHGELVVRYPGPNDKKTVLASAKDITFSFEDITEEEINIKPALPRAPMRAPNNPVSGDEIRCCLPGWTVNEITPLEEIGEAAPTNNYSYAQAGRLYESFRKKKKKRQVVENDNHGFENHMEMEDIKPVVSSVAMAHPTSPREAVGYPPQNSSIHGASAAYIHPQTHHDHSDRQFDQNKQYNREGPPQKPERRDRRTVRSAQYPDVHIRDVSKSPEWFNKQDYPKSLHASARDGYDSNQSSFSTAASSDPPDSGYHGNETDSERFYHDNSYNHMKIPHSHKENLGFHHEEDDQDEIMRKHKDFVNKMLREKNLVNNNQVPHPKDHGYGDHSKQNYDSDYSHYNRSPNSYKSENSRLYNYENQNGQYGHSPRKHEETRGHYGNSPPKTTPKQHNSRQFNFGAESMSESFI